MRKKLTKAEKLNKLKNMLVLDMNITEPKKDIDRLKIKSYCLYLITDISQHGNKISVTIQKYRANLAEAYPIKKNVLLDKFILSNFIHFDRAAYGKDIIDISFEDTSTLSRVVYDKHSVKDLLLKDIETIIKLNKIKNCTININISKAEAVEGIISNKFKVPIEINGIRCRDTSEFRDFSRQFLYNSMEHRPFYGNPDLNAFVLVLRVLKGVIYDR